MNAHCVEPAIRTVMMAVTLELGVFVLELKDANRYRKSTPALAAWLKQAAPEAFTVLRIPIAYRRRMRKTNGLERPNKEIKRRTRVAALFLNDASLLRFASAVLSEISDDWETERVHLEMESR